MRNPRRRRRAQAAAVLAAAGAGLAMIAHVAQLPTAVEGVSPSVHVGVILGPVTELLLGDDDSSRRARARRRRRF